MDITTLSGAVDSLWIMISGVLVFLMQAGFSLLEVGTIRAKNAQNILLKNFLDVCLGIIIWWLVGYGFAYGKSSDEFIGSSQFAGNGFEGVSYRDWFFQMVFASTAATIVSGSLAERTQVMAYSLFSCFITGWIYPVVVHWTWGGGWLGQEGYLDFAGSGIVHMVGGVCGLCGAAIIGPRLDRFTTTNPAEFKPHNMPLAMLGVFILWFGWYGFNAGSTLSFTEGNDVTAALVAMNTSISAAAGGLTVLFLKNMLSNCQTDNIMHYDVLSMGNGILAGLVAITAGCANVEPYGAFIIGILGGLVYNGCSYAVQSFGVDDPLDAFAVHGGAGMWGVIALGFFHTDDGVFYGGSGKLLAWQICGVVVITAWSAFWASLMFMGLNAVDKLRISEIDERSGIDNAKHGGSAYHIRNHNDVELDRLNRVKSPTSRTATTTA